MGFFFLLFQTKASEKRVGRAMQTHKKKNALRMGKKNMIAQNNKHHINLARTETHRRLDGKDPSGKANRPQTIVNIRNHPGKPTHVTFPLRSLRSK